MKSNIRRDCFFRLGLSCFLTVLFLLSVTVGITMVPGCAGTPNRVAYQASVSSRITVEEGLGLYNVWDGAQQAKGINTAANDAKVRAAFTKWKAAQIAVLELARGNSVLVGTNAAGGTGWSALLQDAIDREAQLRSEFFNLLTVFGVSLPGASPTFAPVK